MAFGQLQDEVPGMSDEASAGLEQSLLQARQRPALDGDRQDQPTQEIAEVVGDHPKQQADLIGPEPVTGEAGARGGGVCPPFSPPPPPPPGCGGGGGAGGARPKGGEGTPPREKSTPREAAFCG